MPLTRQEQEAPTPPPTPPAPGALTTVGPDGKPVTLTIPSTRAEVRELRAQREELSNQLISATERRRRIAEEIQNTSTRDVATRTGLEERMRLLDQRILQLETDITTTGRQLSSAPAQLMAMAEARESGGDGFEEGMMIGGFSTIVMASLLILFLRRRWRRPTTRADDIGSDAIQRLQRLEHGLDAIAIEIERVTEGQRFVTKLLSEPTSPLGASSRRGQPAHAELEDPAKR